MTQEMQYFQNLRVCLDIVVDKKVFAESMNENFLLTHGIEV